MPQITITFDVSDDQWERLRRLREEMDSVGLLQGRSESDLFGQVIRTASALHIEDRLVSLEAVMRRGIERKRKEAQALAAQPDAETPEKGGEAR